MDESFYTAQVPSNIADLIPGFLRNRHAEVAQLRALLQKGDYDKIIELADRMTGVGTPYGFPFITNQARNLREIAQRQDRRALSELIDDLDKYLRAVKITVKPPK